MLNTFFSRQAAAVAAVLFVGVPQPACAHDLLLIPERGGLVVRYGHPQDWQPLLTQRLVDLQVFADADGQPSANPAAQLKKRGLDFVLPAAATAKGPLLVAGRYDNGLWSRVPQPGSDKPRVVNTTRLMLPDATLVTANLKFAKALIGTPGDGALFMRRVGHLLELVPQRNPLALQPGELLPVLVLLDGKPLPNAGIEVGNVKDAIPEDRIQRHVTGADGIAQVPLLARGLQMLGVDVEVPNDGSLDKFTRVLPVADKLVLVATYGFVR